jgi:hypothetical protein
MNSQLNSIAASHRRADLLAAAARSRRVAEAAPSTSSERPRRVRRLGRRRAAVA